MQQEKRRIFGIIGAEVNCVAQRELLKGIIEQAKRCNIDIAVLSNIYNLNANDNELQCENKIYDLIFSSEYDGLILLSEPFINEQLQKTIHQYLLQQHTVPLVIAGTPLPDFYLPNATLINTSDENDMEDVTTHLIEEHGFHNIDILTGYNYIDVSHLRVNGYKKALQKHNIPFDENKVYYGDFWTSSGRKLAKKYISGELPYPEAVICANDHMAYGILDEFAENNINILDRFTVVGYDFENQRHIHSPLLTTYQRNREQLGRDAVRILLNKINHIEEKFTPPKGKLIHGISCPCSFSKVQLHDELKHARIKNEYESWNLTSQMNQKLTDCRTLDEFIKIVGEFQFLVRCIQNIYICLHSNWYEYKPDIESDQLICQSVMPWLDRKPFYMNKYHFSDLFMQSEAPAAYYFNPLFFKNRTFGYLVLKYDNPDTYDDIFRNWIKSISNGLEFLRLKNDIRYLTQCKNLSETQDTLTALKNDKGVELAYNSSKYIYNNEQNVFFIMLKVCLFQSDFSNFGNTNKIDALLDVADAFRKFCRNQNTICGRINDTTFACIMQKKSCSAEQLADLFYAILTQHTTYIKSYGMDSFLFHILPCNKNDTYEKIKEECTLQLDRQFDIIFQKRKMKHYSQMLEIRNKVYLNPEVHFSTDEICKQYGYSPGYLRINYKNCFDISFHQDCINSRMSMAKFFLYTTNLNLTAIAEQCGYIDPKYFLRQFMTCTGITPNQYRAKIE